MRIGRISISGKLPEVWHSELKGKIVTELSSIYLQMRYLKPSGDLDFSVKDAPLHKTPINPGSILKDH